MLKVGDKVKLNVKVLEEAGFDELNETDVLFIKENPDEIYVIERDWYEHLPYEKANLYRYELKDTPFHALCFTAEELVLVEENAG